MANLAEVSQWENVIRQLENGEAATGGADGLANVQAKQLANRTKWLKDNLAPIVNAAFSGTLKHGNNDLAGAAIVAKSLDVNGYVKYASGLTIQWGHVDITNASRTLVTFPINFAVNACAFLATINWKEHSNDTLLMRHIDSGARNSAVVVLNEIVSGTTRINWIAIGY